MRFFRVTVFCLAVLTAIASQPPAQPGAPNPIAPNPTAPNPIAAQEGVFVEDLTWMEVRDAVKAGKTTIIIPTGGVEQNGPYLITGKHDYVVRAVSESIARKLGNALVAPVVPFVPEGNIEPPTEHMKYPGTISLREDTYERLLTDICASFKTHGFTDIILLGDSGGNQKGMKAVAGRLNAQWRGKGARTHFIPEFYDHDMDGWLVTQGLRQKPEGLHDDFVQTATLAAIDPQLIRMKQRVAAGKFHINGINLNPVENTIAWGRKIIAERTRVSAEAIQQSIKNGR